jgi:hypothetical protein
MYRCHLGAPITANFWKGFVGNIKGALTDHANDQKLMIQLFTQWKRELERETRGSAYLSSLAPLEVLELLNQALTHPDIPVEPWESLSPDDQVRRAAETFRKLCLEHGEAEFQKLSPEEQFEVDLFIWAGCCMHKSLNASKAGFDAMTELWKTLKDVVGPAPLLNKDNVTVLEHGTLEDKERVLALAKAGAYKLLELLGALLKNRDDKKGQQDLYKIERLRALGDSLAFPDVSNTRFSTFLYASAAVIVNLPFYQDLMKLIRDAKTNPGWNNLERNCAVGLADTATLTELCAASIYLVVVEKSYITRVRGGQPLDSIPPPIVREESGRAPRKRIKKTKPVMQDENLLDLTDFHEQVVDFCECMAAEPELLLQDEYPKTFDGQDLDPESCKIMDAVRGLHAQLPHLKLLLAAFFRGAHAKWLNFTAEFAEDAAMAKLSCDQRRKAFLNTTNDANEGALGMLRVALRRAPNMSLFTYNSLMMIRQNNVAEFFATLDAEGLAFVRAEARRLAHGSVEKLRRIELAEHRFLKAQLNAQAREDKARKDAERKAREDTEMQGVELEQDSTKIHQLKGKKLQLQILWHRRNQTRDTKTGKLAVIGITNLLAPAKRDRLVELAAMAKDPSNANPDRDRDSGAAGSSETHRVCTYNRVCAL